MAIPVRRYKRHKDFKDDTSQLLNYLKLEPGAARMRDLEYIARDLELIGSMSQDDVMHVLKGFVKRLKIILTDGDKVRVDGLGIFHLTFNSLGVEDEKDVSVKNIRKVNIRFRVDNTLRLVNDSTASTRGGDNNVKFYIKGEADAAASTGNGGDNTGGDTPGGGDDWEDPTA